MKEELISFETAKLAKKKGLSITDTLDMWEKYTGYKEDKSIVNFGKSYFEIIGKDSIYYPCCTLTLLQKWLREIHRIHIVINLWIDMDRQYHYNYTLSQEYYPGTTNKTFIPFTEYVNETGKFGAWRINHPIKEKVYSWRTYEQALEAGLLEALKLIK